jgi:conjugal transfer mating pair stabilization protein TraG
MSGQMSEDSNQQFAQYVRKHAPQDADTLLTNTSSAEIAGKRRTGLGICSGAGMPIGC